MVTCLEPPSILEAKAKIVSFMHLGLHTLSTTSNSPSSKIKRTPRHKMYFHVNSEGILVDHTEQKCSVAAAILSYFDWQ